MPINHAVAAARGRVAALTRSRDPDDPDLIAAREDLAAANLEAAITRTTDVSPARRAHLAGLLAADGRKRP